MFLLMIKILIHFLLENFTRKMKVVSKKLKEKRRSDVDRVKEYLEMYSHVHTIQNNSLPNTVIQTIRSGVDGKLLFVKRSMLQKQYPGLRFDGSCFLLFSNENLTEKLGEFMYPDFLKAGEHIDQRIAIPAGILRNEKLVPMLDEAVPQGANSVLVNEYVVCEEGDVLTEKQAKILQILGNKFAQSNLHILSIQDSASLAASK